MNIAYFGCNSNCSENWGCLSTPKCLGELIEDNIKNINSVTKLGNKEMLKKNLHKIELLKNIITKNDIIIINGEGSPIFSSPERVEFKIHLDIIEYALRQNKKVLYLNTMISKCPATGLNEDTYNRALNLWAKCDLITVRDDSSISFLPELSNVFYVPDALFIWSDKIKEIKKENYICISGGSYPTHLQQDVQTKYNIYKEITQYISKNYPHLSIKIVQTCGRDYWLKNFSLDNNLELIPLSTKVEKGFEILSSAKLFISGRFHPSIMASIGGCPCIHFISNSNKTTYLQKMLEYDNPKSFEINSNSLSEIFKLIDFYIDNKSIHEKLFNKSKKLSEKCKNDYKRLLSKF